MLPKVTPQLLQVGPEAPPKTNPIPRPLRLTPEPYKTIDVNILISSGISAGQGGWFCDDYYCTNEYLITLLPPKIAQFGGVGPLHSLN